MSRERDIKLRERLKNKMCMSLSGFRKTLLKIADVFLSFYVASREIDRNVLFF